MNALEAIQHVLCPGSPSVSQLGELKEGKRENLLGSPLGSNHDCRSEVDFA